MRKKVIAGNWKMNNDERGTKKLIQDIQKAIKNFPLSDTRVIVAPAFVNLLSAIREIKNSKIEVAAQNMHQAKKGAFTGEISAEMLKGISVKTVILGHSERRTFFKETDEILSEKVNSVLENNLEAIFCFGELLENRKSNNHFTVVENQLKKGLFHLKDTAWKNIILAYEPVWAIGTGETASSEQIQEMHAFIRKIIAKKYTQKISENIVILYGGSVKPSNATEIFSKPDVDGGLIGGAALNASDFVSIIKAI